jgi:hypothetical protein
MKGGAKVSQRIRITSKPRRDIDVDKLVFALLRIVDDMSESHPSRSPARPERGPSKGGEQAKPEEPAA